MNPGPNRVPATVLGVCLCLAGPVPGQTASGPSRPARPQPPTDRRPGPVLELDLARCLELGLEGNQELKLRRLEVWIAEQDLRRERAAFDPVFFSDASWARRETPSRNTFQPSSTTKTYALSVGLRKKVLSGGTIELALRPTFIDQRVQSIFNFPSTQFVGELSLTLTQPLLRGAWSDAQEAGIRKAELEHRARTKDFERSRQTLLAQIVGAYFDLVFAREDWRVKHEALEVARAQLANTENRIRIGELGPRDLVADQAEVARREEELIQAENSILDREDDLKRLLFPFAGTDEWEIVLKPKGVPPHEDPEYPVPPFQEAFREALEHRPDLQAAALRVERARVELARAERDLLPTLDLTGSYATDAVTDDTGDLQRDVFSQRFPDYSLQLSFEVPIGNRAARSAWRSAKLALEQAGRNLQILRTDVAKEVRAALRALAVQRKSIAAARESVRLAESNLETERIKLSLDSTTLFEVQRRNQELADARSRLLRARLEYRKAWYDLQAALGRLTPASAAAASRPAAGRSPGADRAVERR